MRYFPGLVALMCAAFLLYSCATAPVHKIEYELLFSDDFENDQLEDNWTTGSECPDRPTIQIVDGRVEATTNCNFIETRQEFSGNLKIEFDIEKVGEQNYGGWDFAVTINEAHRWANIRFDEHGVDGINIDGPADEFTIPGEAINRGTAILTYFSGMMQFVFVNDEGQELISAVRRANEFERSKIRIHIAGERATPRYVDNVRIYGITADVFRADVSSREHFEVIESQRREKIEFMGHTYQLIKDSTDFDTAKGRCEQMGGYLVRIDNDEENRFITETFVHRIERHVMIGATDRAQEGVWLWADGSKVEFTRWGENEPNNANDEDYVELTGGGHWNDLQRFDEQKFYICEWDTSP